MSELGQIRIKGAREHNLRNLDIEIPRGKLTVVTGVSGSGKSSLAFDTLYAEGYRKYIDSLSVKARQVLDQIKRPDVDYIEGLSPVIAIEQREAAGTNPRSTVATVTEIADYARLLWAVRGEMRCPKDGGRIERRSLDDCLARIFAEPEGSRLMLLAHFITAKPAILREELPRLRQRGFERVRINGAIHRIDEPKIIPSGPTPVRVDIVIDRIVLRPDQRSRLADSLELAFREGGDSAIVMVEEKDEAGAENAKRTTQNAKIEKADAAEGEAGAGDGGDGKVGEGELSETQKGAVGDGGGAAQAGGFLRSAFSVLRLTPGWIEFTVSQHLSCAICGETFEPLTPRAFSWNHPEGACPTCGGLGETLQFREDLIVPDPKKSVKNGAIKPWRLGSKAMIIKHNAILKQLAEQLPFDPKLPWEELDPETRHTILHGAGDRLFHFKLKPGNSRPEPMPFAGVLADLDEIRRTTTSDGLKARLMAFQTRHDCPDCHGQRLRAISRATRLAEMSFPDFMAMPIRDALAFVEQLLRPALAGESVSEAVEGLEQRLRFLVKVGLDYLALDRSYASLSGGEAQRARLATQLGMGLVGVTYVLDEPSIGLHPSDVRRLIQTLCEMRDRGNTVVVVEHDAETIRAADHLIELGPGAGSEGGELLFAGTPETCMTAPASRTGPFLKGSDRIYKNAEDREAFGSFIRIKNAREHNLKGIDVRIPMGLLTVVCGVSGSGKSTLINDILGRAAAFKLNNAKVIPGAHDGINGLESFNKVIRVDQEPIGRSPRSNPATYIKLFDLLRDLFSRTPLARVRGYTASRFSFNTPGGRCERCKGDGQIALDMQFLSDAYVECPSCQGRRYNRETLEVLFKGHSIADVLNLTVEEGLALFEKQPKVAEKLQTLEQVGLGYLKIGQPANTLSGGEAQRIKLSLELSRRQQGDALYILDEPTTGLHWIDVQRL
ncbi:MAG: excinuclease ABC subunit UvrA, partial [Verrucomicrobiota bacterium]